MLNGLNLNYDAKLRVNALTNPNAMDEVDDFIKGLEDIINSEKGDLVEKNCSEKDNLHIQLTI